MKINLVCLQEGIVSHGVRRLAAFLEQTNSDTRTYFVSTNNQVSALSLILSRYGGTFPDCVIDDIANRIVDADVIGFSSMTGYADLTRRLIERIKRISNRPFIVWGGIHPIVDPQDAILADVDAICVGEGEFAFQEFLELRENGKDFTSVKNFWFKRNNAIIRNGLRPLITSEELNTFPFPKYAENEMIYSRNGGFKKATRNDFVASNGLSYPTIWTIGCAFQCTYCANTIFIEDHPQYRKPRHPEARYIVEEVKQARIKHPHISAVKFNDDNFLALDIKVLHEFSKLWRQEVGIPFAIYGVHPNCVRYDKLEILTWAGLNRVHMGIQSGSKRILDFYNRPTPIEKIKSATEIISKLSKYHIPPSFDMIVDNPIETKQDIIDTLELLYQLPRPFFLDIFSLRITSNTLMEKQMEELGVSMRKMDEYYYDLNPRTSNILFYLLTFYKPPRWLFEKLLKRVRDFGEPQKLHHFLAFIFRSIYLVKRGCSHLRFMDFSVGALKGGYIAWRLGIIGFWDKFINPKLSLDDVEIDRIVNKNQKCSMCSDRGDMAGNSLNKD